MIINCSRQEDKKYDETKSIFHFYKGCTFPFPPTPTPTSTSTPTPTPTPPTSPSPSPAPSLSLSLPSINSKPSSTCPFFISAIFSLKLAARCPLGLLGVMLNLWSALAPFVENVALLFSSLKVPPAPSEAKRIEMASLLVDVAVRLQPFLRSLTLLQISPCERPALHLNVNPPLPQPVIRFSSNFCPVNDEELLNAESELIAAVHAHIAVRNQQHDEQYRSQPLVHLQLILVMIFDHRAHSDSQARGVEQIHGEGKNGGGFDNLACNHVKGAYFD